MKFIKIPLLLLVFLFSNNIASAQLKSILKRASTEMLKRQTGHGQQAQEESTSVTDTTYEEHSDQIEKHMAPEAAPTAPKFEKTGKIVKAVEVKYAVDKLAYIDALLQKTVIVKGIALARKQGLSGTDRLVLVQVLEDPKLFAQLAGALSSNSANASELKDVYEILRPSITFGAMIGSFKYNITNTFIRGEMDDAPGSIGKSLFDKLGGAVSIVDIGAKKNYAISNYLNVIPAAVVTEVPDVKSVFEMTEYCKNLIKHSQVKSSIVGKALIANYQSTGVRFEIPVKPGINENGKPDDGLLYLHCLFNNNWDDFESKNYDPKYKIYLEMYYSHDLDKMVPDAITKNKGLLGFDGFFVGFKLKDEQGRFVTYAIKDINPNYTMDEGMFKLPVGYPIMTQVALNAEILKKMGLKN